MIIGFLGNLQSGKSSSCRYVVGEVMKKSGLIQKFGMTEDGMLIVPDRDGNYGIFDFEKNNSDTMTNFRRNILDKMVSIINFADPLKQDCCKYFGIPEELVWGGKKDKDTLLKITWGDIQDVFKPAFDMDVKKKKKRMSVRDVLITYADMVRSINPEAFVNAAFHKISKSEADLFLIGDVRYEYEVNAIRENGGKVIRLNKIVELTGHSSEQAHTIDPSLVNLEVNNDELTMKEKNMVIKESLIQWGVI